MTNLEKMQSVLETESVDALLLTSQTNRLYAAEYDVAEGVAVIGKAKSWYFTDSRYIEVAQKYLPAFEVLEVNRQNSYPARINAALEELGASTMGVEEEYLTYAEFLHYEKTLNARLKPCQKSISCFRETKNAWEIELMVKAQQITDKSFLDVLKVIKEGMTEKELAAELIHILLKNGSDGLAFNPIVVSGPNTSRPHGVPGDRKLEKGDFITMDFGAKHEGYCADMTRTVALGYATDEMVAVYETVLRAQQAAIAMTKAGVPGRDVDMTARQIIEDAGFGPYFGHGYGHGLGIEVHEAPNCNLGNENPLPVGAVCSAEPGIYIPGKFGVRIEDVVILQEDGCRDITESPKNLIVL